MGPYETLLQEVYQSGGRKFDRTGTGTVSLFGRQIRYDLSQGFPLITSKKVPFRIVAEELLWFLRGTHTIRELLEKDVHIWSEWPFVEYLKAFGLPIPENGSPEWKAQLAEFEQNVLNDDTFAQHFGDLGPVYGAQWRSWGAQGQQKGIDQIARAIELIRHNPDSRRIVVSAWNPTDLPYMALEPCHTLFQFYVLDGRLSCQLYQRSADMFLGVPFNLASYALLTHMMAQQCDLEVGELIWTGGDVHIYRNHLDQVHEQLQREPRPLPQLEIVRRPPSIFDYDIADFSIVGYTPHPAIKGEVAV